MKGQSERERGNERSRRPGDMQGHSVSLDLRAGQAGGIAVGDMSGSDGRPQRGDFFCIISR